MIVFVVPAAPGVDVRALVALAEDFSPRVERGASGVALDGSGVARLFGGAEGFAREIAREAAVRGLAVRVAVAATRTAATLVANVSLEGWKVGRSGAAIVVPAGREREALAPLPLTALTGIADLIGLALEKAAAGAPARRRKGQGRNYRLAPGPNQQITNQQVTNQQVSGSIERLHKWGLKTLDDLARLPASELSARLGPAGLVLQRAARGEDERPLVPLTPPVSFLQSLALEWPIDDLQPLSFVVARLCDDLEQALARADRGAIVVMTRLRLVTKVVHARTLTLPAPMRDARVLRTLVMLDLESHPPEAAIDEVAIDVDIAPARILQTGLFEPALPAPETISTLVARLSALAGSSRIGAPALEDTHRPGAFAMKPFAPHAARPEAGGQRPEAGDQRPEAGGQRPEARGRRPEARAARDDARAAFKGSPAAVVPPDSGLEPLASGLWPDHTPAVLRRFRPARAARVRVERQRPSRVEAGNIRGDVTMAAGPWRTSGGWWTGTEIWDRDEWDVALDTGVHCRLAQDRATRTWVMDGVLD